MNARRPEPSPRPSPVRRERENYFLCSGNADALGRRALSSAGDETAGITRNASKLSGDADSCSLSSGERAGVRACVNFPKLTFLLTQILRRNSSGIIRQWMRRTFLQLAKNRVANGLLFAPQVRIPKAKFLNAHRSEKSGPLGVVSLLIGMPVSTAVEFNGEPRFFAEKIKVVNSNRMSSPKFVGAESPVTQPTPDELFRPRRFLAQSAGAFDVGHGQTIERPENLGRNQMKTLHREIR